MKKLVSFLLVALLVFSVVGTAFAEGENVTVTEYTEPEIIQNPVGGSITIPYTDTMDANFVEDPYGGGNDSYSSLMIHTYNLVVNNREGQLIVNPVVVKEMKTEVNADGSKTYTITLRDDLKFNDGSEITAMNYVAYPLLFSSPIGVASGAYGNAGKYFVGFSAFNKGEDKVFKGVRLLDKYQFSYTIAAENVPYYYELQILNCSQYAKAFPLDWETWCPGFEIKDDGEGCYVVGEKDWYDTTDTELAKAIGDTRFAWKETRTDGAYYVANCDLSAQVTELKINPYYKSDWAGYKPSIETITIVKANKSTLQDSLKTGEIDYVSLNNATGAQIESFLDLVESDEKFAEVHYVALSYGKIFFRCDYGPYQFLNVRKAINYLIDKDALVNELFNGHGSTIPGPVSSAYWMYQENEEEILERTDPYTFNPDKAKELLIEDGWVLDENGDEYKSGLRWKEVTALEYNPWGNGEYDFGNSKGDPQNRCKQLPDGRVIMPLVIEWLSLESLPELGQMLDVQLVQSKTAPETGFQFNRTVLGGGNFWNYLNSSLDDFFYPTYGMFNSSTGLRSAFDQTFRYSTDPDHLRENKNRIFDKALDDYANNMLIGMDPTDDEGYARQWVEYLVRSNEILYEIALYNTERYAIYSSKLQNYVENAHFGVAYAICQAYVG